MTEHFNDAIGRIPGKKRKCEAAAQSSLFCDWRAREICVNRDIANPGGLIRLPNAPGQTSLFCDWRPREICVNRYIANPGGLIRLPNAPGQTDAHWKVVCARVLSKLLQFVRACFPKSRATQYPPSFIMEP